MTLAFEHRLSRPRGVTLIGIAVGTIAVVGAVLTVTRVHSRAGVLAAAAAMALCVALMVLGVGRLRAARAARRLQVDAAGRARLIIDGHSWHCLPQRWLLADEWAALRVRIERDEGGVATVRTMDLLTGPGGDLEAWRRLRVWLSWLQRGQLPDGSYDESSAPPAHTKPGDRSWHG